LPPSQPEVVIYGLWAFWVLSWFAAAIWTSRTVKRPFFGSEIVYRFVTVIGALMLFGSFRAARGLPHLWPYNEMLDWAMAALTATGIAFTWWARIHLGRLWSGNVTKKAGHHVVDTGPYRIVRHPIYTGIILASYATAVASGTLVAFVGATVMLLGWYIKARLEERFLRVELDAQAYDAYAARVPMLIPFVKI
jgi:protein-S-isoprenylcysteine O-methyltransferase Ste14